MIPKSASRIERDTQEETQPLEPTHSFAHICCQIPSPSPAGLSYDQQCYQWFTDKLNCLMDTYLSSSASQSTEATYSVAKWSLSDRFMSNPYCIFCDSGGCKKVKKAHYWTIKPCRGLKQDHDFLLWIQPPRCLIMISFYGYNRQGPWTGATHGGSYGGGGGGGGTYRCRCMGTPVSSRTID